jgi:hypothetical protein
MRPPALLKGAAAQTPEMKRVMKRHGAFGATACGMMKMAYRAKLMMNKFLRPYLDERTSGVSAVHEEQMNEFHPHLGEGGPNDRTENIAEKEEGDDQSSRRFANLKFCCDLRDRTGWRRGGECAG